METPRGQPRRLAFARGPLPEGSTSSCVAGPLEDELRALAAEGVQSLLLEGGPTLAASFLDADLVDKLLLFVAPTLAGAGATAFRLRYAPRARSPSCAPARSGRTCSSRPMSTTPDSQRTDDQIVTPSPTGSTGQVGNDELRQGERRSDTDELAPGGRKAVEELLVELGRRVPGERGELEVIVRETVEALVYGD